MPDKNLRFRGKYVSSREHIGVNLPLIEFEEDGTQIIYCPALDIQGYGVNETEAKNSFNIVLEEYLRYTLNKETFFSELSRMGWKIKKGSKPMVPPDLCHSLAINENFNRIFNQHDFRKYEQHIEMPVAC